LPVPLPASCIRHKHRHVTTTRGQLLRMGHPGCWKLGHPAPGTTIHRVDTAWRSSQMTLHESCDGRHRKITPALVKKPPRSIPRRGRAGFVVGDPVGSAWEVTRIGENAAQYEAVCESVAHHRFTTWAFHWCQPIISREFRQFFHRSSAPLIALPLSEVRLRIAGSCQRISGRRADFSLVHSRWPMSGGASTP